MPLSVGPLHFAPETTTSEVPLETHEHRMVNKGSTYTVGIASLAAARHTDKYDMLMFDCLGGDIGLLPLSAFILSCLCWLCYDFMTMRSCRKGHQAVREALQTGLTTYTIPGIAFGMPTSVGPLHFAPVFTSRRTAEIAWVRGPHVKICMLYNHASCRSS